MRPWKYRVELVNVDIQESSCETMDIQSRASECGHPGA